MRVWIVGKEGLLARALAKACQQRGLEFFATGQSEADIARIETLEPFASRATHVINCAAYTNVDLAEKETAQAYAINADGPLNLAKVARGKLLHVSTDYVFDGKQDRPYAETDLCNPLSIYGKSKRAGEEKLLALRPDACIVRTSWLFGDGGKSFISMMLRLMQTQSELKVAGDQVGSPTFVDDLAHALLDLLDHSGLFHYTNGGALTRYQIAEEMLNASKRVGLPLRCEKLIPAPFVAIAERPPYSVLDIKKVEQALGKPCRDWKEAIEEHVKNAL